MMNRHYKALELDKILDLLAGETGCADAAAMARGLEPEIELSEVRRLGFTKCLIPARTGGKLDTPDGLQLIPVRNIREALAALL